jgi:hypothetical protein
LWCLLEEEWEYSEVYPRLQEWQRELRGQGGDLVFPRSDAPFGSLVRLPQFLPSSIIE